MERVLRERAKSIKAADALCDFHGLKAISDKRDHSKFSPRANVSLAKAVYTTLWLAKVVMMSGVDEMVKALRKHVRAGLVNVYNADTAAKYDTYLFKHRFGDDVMGECTRLALTSQFGPKIARDELVSSNANEAMMKRSQEVGLFQTYAEPTGWCESFTGVSRTGKRGRSVASLMTSMVESGDHLTRLQGVLEGQYRGALAIYVHGGVRKAGWTAAYGDAVLDVYEVDVDARNVAVYNSMVCTFKKAGVVRLPDETEVAMRPMLAARDKLLFNGMCRDGVSLVFPDAGVSDSKDLTGAWYGNGMSSIHIAARLCHDEVDVDKCKVRVE
jgi:hypothetical protein